MPLTDALCKNARVKPGQQIRKLSERGLQLCLYPNGSKLWRIAYRRDGKAQTLSLGPYPAVSLGDARLKREEVHKLLRNGQDPGTSRKEELANRSESFQVWADRFTGRLEKEGRAEATMKKQKWLISMATESLADLPISAITAPKVLEAIRKVEARGTLDTAVRLRSTISAIFQDAIAAGVLENDPAAYLGRLIAKPRRQNHPGLVDPHRLSQLLKSINAYQGKPATRAALQLAALLFTRPSELRKAEWQEFDLNNLVWRIPAARMKMKREHLVPLSDQAVEILKRLFEVTGGAKYTFPSVRTSKKPLSENTLNAALRGLGYSKEEHTAHGFRTTASTLLNGSGLWHPDAIERQLAHEEKNSVRRAYDHQTHWPQRIRMMTWWAEYLNSLQFGTAVPFPINDNATPPASTTVIC